MKLHLVLAGLLLAALPLHAAPIAASVSAYIGVPNGVAPLTPQGTLNRDVTQRAPTQYDDQTASFSPGDGYNGFWTDNISYGDFWGYLSAQGYLLYQDRSAFPNNADWEKYTSFGGWYPCDGLTTLSCTAAYSFYPMTTAFQQAGTNVGTVWKVSGGVLTSQGVPQAVPYQDASFAKTDAFCANATWISPCKFVPTEQMSSIATTPYWSIVPYNANGGLATVVLASAGSGSGQTGSKTVQLNMAGCTTVGTPALVTVTISGGSVTAVTGISNIGQCNAQAASPTASIGGQTGVAGGTATFTTYPTFTVLWWPFSAPGYPLAPNLGGLRGMVWNTWPNAANAAQANSTGLAAFNTENRTLKAASGTYNSVSSWVAMLGEVNNSGGGARTLITTSDCANGVNLSNSNNHISTSAANTAKITDSTGAHTATMPIANPTSLVLNLNSGQPDIWIGNDYIHGSTTWTGSSTTGFILGADANCSANPATTSIQGDVAAILMGATPASSAAGYKDLNGIRAGLTRLGQLTPQANNVLWMTGGSLSMGQGDDSDQHWYRIGLNQQRTSSGQPIQVKAYNYAASGQQIATLLNQFYSNGDATQYFDSGCDMAPVCMWQMTGFKNDISSLCSGNGASCTSTAKVAFSGTTATVSNNTQVLVGTVLSGGAGLTGTPTIVGFQSGATGTNGNYTVNINQGTLAAQTLNTATTWANTAQGLAGIYKNYIYEIQQLGTGWRAASATLPATVGMSGTWTVGQAVTLAVPTGSGISCQVTITGGAPQSSAPILVVSHVNPTTGFPDQFAIPRDWGHHGACYGGTLPTHGFEYPAANYAVTQTGWIPSGGGTSWGSATIALTLYPQSYPQAIAGTIPLQNTTLTQTEMLGVFEPVALGGVGWNDDMIANMAKAQATPCTTPATCLTLGSGYGAAYLNNQVGDPLAGPGPLYSYSPFAYPSGGTVVNGINCSADGDHPLYFCQMALGGNFGAIISQALAPVFP